MIIYYECPDCGHLWQEEYECACDSTCPECGTRNIQALEWEDTSIDVPQLLENADKYPLNLRIAAKLFADGIREESFRGMTFPFVPDPVRLSVQNHLRDIEIGFTKLDDTLLALAETTL